MASIGAGVLLFVVAFVIFPREDLLQRPSASKRLNFRNPGSTENSRLKGPCRRDTPSGSTGMIP